MWQAPLLQEAEKGKPASPQILNVRRLLGTEVAKSHVVPAAAGVTSDFKTVEQQDPMLTSQIITVMAAQIAALVKVRKSHCHVFVGGLDPRQAPLKTVLLMLRQT